MRKLMSLLVIGAALSGCRGNVTILGDQVQSVPGYDLDAVALHVKQSFLKILHSELCPCGDAHHVARCLASSLKCDASRRLAQFAMRRLAAGDDLSRVVLMVDRLFQQGDKPVLVPIGGAPLRGDVNAPVTVVAFSDFECPFCQKAHFEMKKALSQLGAKVRLAFLHFPLLRLHPNAMLAAQAAVAAQHQDRFWEMHDLLFEHQKDLGKEQILALAKKIPGLDVARFEKDLVHPRTIARIKADLALGKKLGIRGTPTVFINGKKLQGAHRFENYRDYVEASLDELGKATQARK